jgi:hypothetical protein
MLLGLMLLCVSGIARAGDVCPALRSQLFAGDQATRIAAIACNEHMLWYRAFIDADGRMASSTVVEAESAHLADGATEAWRRVAGYWRESGLLWQMQRHAGAGECVHAGGGRYPSPSCRAFVVDQPWSAAFVSYVMKRADLPGFDASASHYDYVGAAYRNPQENAFQYLDPASAKPATGDLLCYVRVPSRAYGYQGLLSSLGQGADGLPMHCDIVVAANPGNDGKAYLVGGNVQQGVTMRILPLNRNGQFWALPQRHGAESACSPDNAAACNFNRQDWAVLLKLKSPAALARLPRATPVPTMASSSQAQQCCTTCVVGSGVPRCPAGVQPLQPQTQAAPQQCCTVCVLGSGLPRCPRP